MVFTSLEPTWDRHIFSDSLRSPHPLQTKTVYWIQIWCHRVWMTGILNSDLVSLIILVTGIHRVWMTTVLWVVAQQDCGIRIQIPIQIKKSWCHRVWMTTVLWIVSAQQDHGIFMAGNILHKYTLSSLLLLPPLTVHQIPLKTYNYITALGFKVTPD